MANLNLGQDVAIKENEHRHVQILWPNHIPLQQASGMRRCGSLININPSGFSHERLRFAALLKSLYPPKVLTCV